jgi:hypothetical protein
MILAVAAVVTLALGAAALNIDINPTLDRLRSVTPAAVSLERIAPRFGLPYDVYLVLQRGADLDGLLVEGGRGPGFPRATHRGSQVRPAGRSCCRRDAPAHPGRPRSR